MGSSKGEGIMVHISDVSGSRERGVFGLKPRPSEPITEIIKKLKDERASLKGKINDDNRSILTVVIKALGK